MSLSPHQRVVDPYGGVGADEQASVRRARGVIAADFMAGVMPEWWGYASARAPLPMRRSTSQSAFVVRRPPQSSWLIQRVSRSSPWAWMISVPSAGIRCCARCAVKRWISSL